MGNTTSHTHEPLERGYTRDAYGDIKNSKFASFRFSKRSPKRMDRLRRSFRDSFRRRKDRVPESSKPLQWPTDEQAVRSSTCSFPVKYLGCVEVFESRGMHICEEALKVLRTSRRRPIRGLLHVSGDGLRVVDDDTKGLIVDQTIEKVSFCAPDRNHERGFSYICRDGTTRRWMCHGFLAAKDSGERLSHAVGCAFAVCLERKQRRDTECSVTMSFDMKNSTFQRNGSFRQTTITDRLRHNERGIDVGPKKSPAAIVPPQPKPFNPYAVERPHATPTMLERQGSFRGFGALNSQSPFKRQMSLRLSDLPSNAERTKSFLDPLTNGHTIRSVSPIPEITAQTQSQTAPAPAPPMEIDVVSALCKELSQGLSMLTQNDGSDEINFNLQTISSANTTTTSASDYVLPSTISADAISKIAAISPIETSTSDYIPMIASTVNTNQITNNPYAPVPRHRASVSGALPSTIMSHLQNTADDSKTNSLTTTTATTTTTTNSTAYDITSSTIAPKIPTSIVAPNNSQLPNADQWLDGQIVKSVSPNPKRAPALHLRAKSLTTDPFNAEWVATVTSKIDELNDLPMKSEKPIIAHTNPFISS